VFLMKQSQPARFDYHFRSQPLLFTPEAILLEFLKTGGSQIFTHKEMVFSALKAYWLPFAYQAFQQKGNAVTNREVRRIAAECARHLEQQLTHIRFMFQLNDLSLDEELESAEDNSFLNHPEDHTDDDPSHPTS
jgi:hypothetical protein